LRTTSVKRPRTAKGLAEPARRARAPLLPLSLFWRTFFLLALLLAGGIFAWMQTLRALDFEPRALATARQTASLVKLARITLRQADDANRAAILDSMTTQQAVRMMPREPGDRWEPFAVDRFTDRVGGELSTGLGPDVVVAGRVNGEPGLWVGFSVDHRPYWLRAEEAPVVARPYLAWFVWIGIALVVTLIGSAVTARLINRPLAQLSFAVSRIRGGSLDSRLDENPLTSEIREVNRGFNRMARELIRMDEDRAVMLAGISHDLRTPLARLRLEAEMSVRDEEAKQNMAADIDQLDNIIDKFMDYARPGEGAVEPIALAALVQKQAASFRDPTQIRITSRVGADVKVLGDEIELERVFLNLFENARRYGRNTPTSVAEMMVTRRHFRYADDARHGTRAGLADVLVTHARSGNWVIVTVRDHGPGVPPERLHQLTTPFFRGDTARTAASGAGLGLAIVEKALQRMGGGLELHNAPDGGLVVQVRLRRAA
jgi:two-component system osmolarity sensor histidine kinase EnvZ